LRAVILETLRLNNPVVTTFRTLDSDYTFSHSGRSFSKGDQFLILNNPVLRDPTFFYEPNRFIPERWVPSLEGSYYAIMFNQGPQKCPGKDLAIFILGSSLVQ
ncbi:MAG: cytochrome P450, partial [Candidatus Aminicenantes bacterium]|nr:cytochrome P450 [Candidatus Aminicenantes bacterium]